MLYVPRANSFLFFSKVLFHSLMLMFTSIIFCLLSKIVCFNSQVLTSFASGRATSLVVDRWVLLLVFDIFSSICN